MLFINRGLIYTFRANRYLLNKDYIKGYALLHRAFNTHTIPPIVISGYIFLSLKYNYLDNAKIAIDYVLSNKFTYKLKDTQRKNILSQQGLYLWKNGDLKAGLDIFRSLYIEGFWNSNFYGSFGCLLYLNGDLTKAEELCLEAYEYDNNDKITLDNLVAIYIATEKWDKAQEFYNLLEPLSPAFPEAFYHGAQLAMYRGETPEAKKLALKADLLPMYNLSSISKDEIQILLNKLEDI
ncbi:MAG: hypothetical protein B6229_06430 [Spirochaetaceae bacterium 4572_7]|nr:MAG: hypothetical protein B6229_06430 [Spirochaetaceae bacterium 4572_7]